MEKLDLTTPNFTNENIAKLAELFPNCVTEKKNDKGEIVHAVDFDALRQEFSDTIVEGQQERYSLNWPGKREALVTANTPISKTLRPYRDESVDFDNTKNIFIEGDNLDALKLLQETYLNKIKMIYIDPPYNTGNDFIYNDNFTVDKDEYDEASGQRDEEGGRLVANPDSNGRFHSDWLSMMYPRLKLANNLLREDGVIFISIDDNEQSNLKRLCGEVFGEGNCLGIIANINNPKGRSDDKFLATAHEYLLVYSKNIQLAKVHGFEPEEKIIKRYNKKDEEGKIYREIDLRKTGDSDRRSDRPDMFYYFYFNQENNDFRVSKNPDKNGQEIEIIPIREDKSEGRWRWGFNTAQEKISHIFPKFMPSRKIWGIFEKDYLEGRPPVKSTTAWSFKDVNSERGSEQFIELGFEKEVFSRPKPIGTLRRTIEIGTLPEEKSIVLDFFAGSSGIAQAVFELTSQRKRGLKLIAIQLPEKISADKEELPAYDFCIENGLEPVISSISKERIRRAGKKIKADNADKKGIENLDTGFRVFKIDSSNMIDVTLSPDEANLDIFDAHVVNIKKDRSSEDLLFQVLLDWGVDLTLSIDRQEIDGKTVFFVDGNALAACFDGDINEDFVKKIAEKQPLRVVFRDDGFTSDSVKINVEQIFKLKSPATDIKVI